MKVTAHDFATAATCKIPNEEWALEKRTSAYFHLLSYVDAKSLPPWTDAN